MQTPVNFLECRVVSFGSVMRANHFASGGTHFFRQTWLRMQRRDGGGQFGDIPNWKQHSGLSVADEFTARAQVRGDDRASVRIRLEDAFAKGFVGARGQHGEPRRGDGVAQALTTQVAEELHIPQSEGCG